MILEIVRPLVSLQKSFEPDHLRPQSVLEHHPPLVIEDVVDERVLRQHGLVDDGLAVDLDGLEIGPFSDEHGECPVPLESNRLMQG